jgi:acyl-CoA thioester hydrolase
MDMDDMLAVVTIPIRVKGASMRLGQRVMRGEELLVEAEIRVARVARGRAQPIPKALRALVHADQDRIGCAAGSVTNP